MRRGMESISLWHCSGVLRAQVALIVTVAGKCKTTLQSVKHFYEARDKFTFWKTFLPIIKHNYMGKTLLPRTKQIYILENK